MYAYVYVSMIEPFCSVIQHLFENVCMRENFAL